jgi:hypothetical protein
MGLLDDIKNDLYAVHVRKIMSLFPLAMTLTEIGI